MYGGALDTTRVMVVVGRDELAESFLVDVPHADIRAWELCVKLFHDSRLSFPLELAAGDLEIVDLDSGMPLSPGEPLFSEYRVRAAPRIRDKLAFLESMQRGARDDFFSGRSAALEEPSSLVLNFAVRVRGPPPIGANGVRPETCFGGYFSPCRVAASLSTPEISLSQRGLATRESPSTVTSVGLEKETEGLKQRNARSWAPMMSTPVERVVEVPKRPWLSPNQPPPPSAALSEPSPGKYRTLIDAWLAYTPSEGSAALPETERLRTPHQRMSLDTSTSTAPQPPQQRAGSRAPSLTGRSSGLELTASSTRKASPKTPRTPRGQQLLSSVTPQAQNMSPVASTTRFSSPRRTSAPLHTLTSPDSVLRTSSRCEYCVKNGSPSRQTSPTRQKFDTVCAEFRARWNYPSVCAFCNETADKHADAAAEARNGSLLGEQQ